MQSSTGWWLAFGLDERSLLTSCGLLVVRFATNFDDHESGIVLQLRVTKVLD